MTTRKLSAVTRRKSLRLSTTITSAIRSRFPSTHIARVRRLSVTDGGTRMARWRASSSTLFDSRRTRSRWRDVKTTRRRPSLETRRTWATPSSSPRLAVFYKTPLLALEVIRKEERLPAGPLRVSDHERVQRGREGSPQRLHQGEE